jgi:sodium--glutamate symport carrier gltS
MASATFGLIIGGIIGGPLAKLLINRYSLAHEKFIEIKDRDTHLINILMNLHHLKIHITFNYCR